MNAWARIGATSKVEKIFREMQERSNMHGQDSLEITPITYNILIKAWALSESKSSLNKIEAILQQIKTTEEDRQQSDTVSSWSQKATHKNNDPKANNVKMSADSLWDRTYKTAWIGYTLYHSTFYKSSNNRTLGDTNNENGWHPSRPDLLVREWQKMYQDDKVSEGPSANIYSQLIRWWQEFPDASTLGQQQRLKELKILEQQQRNRLRQKNC
jgi:hypothetical protein